MLGVNGAAVARLKQPRVFLPLLVGVMLVGATGSYLILFHPESMVMQWFRSEMPEEFGRITIGPYPEEADFQKLKAGGVKYVVSLLDPSLPYERPMLEKEQALGQKYGVAVKNFPMFPLDSMLGSEVFARSRDEGKKAVEFLKNADGPVYMHCYLGKHRAISLQDELLSQGVPDSYFASAGANREYYGVIKRVTEARQEFRNKNFAKVLYILGPVTARDVDVTYLRGWAYYHLGQITDATRSFQEGLEVDPGNPRNLLGLAYCYLKSNQPVRAQRQFEAVLEIVPNETGALTGLGLAHLELHNKPAAAKAFRQVLELMPDNEEVKGYLRSAESS